MATFSVNEEFVRDLVHVATKHNKQIKIGYIDKNGNVENRIVEPLAPFDPAKASPKNFGAHCTLRDGYRHFSYDRVVRIILTDVDRTVDPSRYAPKV